MTWPFRRHHDLRFVFQGEEFQRRRFITMADAERIDKLQRGKPSASKVIGALMILVEPDDRDAFRRVACKASEAKLTYAFRRLWKMNPQMKVRR